MSNIIQAFPKGNGGGHTILDTDGAVVDQEKKLQFTGLDVSDDSTNEKTEVKAVGLNADSLNDIVQSASVQSNAVAGNGLVYSTTEQIVGKWIDGKPIYQKTIDCGKMLNNSSKVIPHNISNLDKLIYIGGFAISPADIKPVPFVNHYNSAYGITVDADYTDIYLASGTDRTNYTAYLTLKYTKTTDT